MKKERKDKDFIKTAYFEGGRVALDAFVKKELRYPKEALAAKIEGTVSVQYTVDYKGKVIEARVIAGIGYGCDEEALRIVKRLLFKVPEVGKVKSKYSRKLHIHFRLPGSSQVPSGTKKTLPTAGPMEIRYEITPSSKPTQVPNTAQRGSYQITISVTPPKKKT